jgi:TonB family protein
MPVCSNCGNQNAANLKFCTACGTPLNTAAPAEVVGRNCSSCGASIPATVKFCLQCGKPISQAAPPPPVAAPLPPQMPPPIATPPITVPVVPPPVAVPPPPPPVATPPIMPPPIAPPPPAIPEPPAEPAWTPVKVPSTEPAVTQPEPIPPAIEPPPAPPSAPQKSLAIPIAAAVILILALCGGGYYGYSVWKKSKAPQPQASAEPAQPAAPIQAPAPVASQPALPPPVQTPPAKKSPLPAASKASHPTGRAALPAAPANSNQHLPVQTPAPQSAPPPPPTPSAPARAYGSRPFVQGVTPIRTVPLQYPQLAKSAHISGEVHLRVIIGTNGAVKDVSVISGNPILSKAAVDAVRQWLYRPVIVSGNITEVETETTINFSL